MKQSVMAQAVAALSALLMLGMVPRGAAMKLSMTVGTGMKVASRAEVMAQMTAERAFSAFMRMNHTSHDPELVALIQQRLGSRARLRSAVKTNPTGYAAVDSARDMLNQMMDEATMKNELENVRCSEFEQRQLKILNELQGDISHCNSESSKARSEILRCQEVITVVEEVKLPTNREELDQHNRKCKIDIAALENQIYIVKEDIKVMEKIIAMVCASDVRTVTQPPFFIQEASDEEDEADADAYQGDGDDGDDFNDDDASGQAALVQCPSCGPSSDPFMWLRHEQVQPMLASLQSQIAKQYVQENLVAAHGETRQVMSLAQVQVEHMLKQMPGVSIRGPAGRGATSLAQLRVGHMRKQMPGINIPAATSRFGLSGMLPASVLGKCDEALMGEKGNGYRGCQTQTLTGRKCQAWTAQSPHSHQWTPEQYNASGIGDHNMCRNPDGKQTIWCYTMDPKVNWEYCEPLLDLKEPDGVTKSDCVETDKCTLSQPNCDKLKERFLVIYSGLIDKKDDLSDSLDTLQDTCETTRKDYENTISTLEGQLLEEQANLAESTKMMVENQQQSHLSKKQHDELESEYHTTMTECCNNKNSLTAEVCALTKIRGELYKLEGTKVFITDCEVGDWADEECSKSCGGGVQVRTRQIIVHPINGTQCPPLKMERACNIEECPVDCQLSEWGAWTECSAPQCGGGVQSRYRQKIVEPKYGGLPCTEEAETRACNTQSCDANCVLADWGKWTECTKMCGGGHRMRSKGVAEPARGLGTCPHPESDDRLETEECGTRSCGSILPPGRSVLTCTSMIDVVILLDGSGSLRSKGWRQSKAMAKTLVEHFKGGENGVNVGLLLFSGPGNWDYRSCSGQGSKQRSAQECGMTWIEHLTTNTGDVVTGIEKMAWPNRGTMTSMALMEAKAELINGRQDATSVVVVITDGKPYSTRKTKKASNDVKKVARLMWIPVGRNIRRQMKKIKQWASFPWEDNVLEVKSFAQLTTPGTLNGMISGLCPRVE